MQLPLIPADKSLVPAGKASGQNCCRAPLIQYASNVWSPHFVTDIRKVESVQHKFTKRLPGYSHLSYPDRLVRLNLDSLVVRRLRHDLILTYKIVFDLTDMNPELGRLFHFC